MHALKQTHTPTHAHTHTHTHTYNLMADYSDHVEDPWIFVKPNDDKTRACEMDWREQKPASVNHLLDCGAANLNADDRIACDAALREDHCVVCPSSGAGQPCKVLARFDEATVKTLALDPPPQ